MNGDLLTSLNFFDLYHSHISRGNDITISTFKKEVKIDLGVLEIKNNKFIVFPEWSFVNDRIKRRDFEFKNLIDYSPFEKGTLFSDLGEEVIIPSPVKDYPLIHFLDIILKNGTKQKL